MNSSIVTGQVFVSKKSGISNPNPKHGDTGWLLKGKNEEGVDIFEEVIYDRGEMGREMRERGGAIFSLEAGWVTLSEHKLRKQARSRFWQKVRGPADYFTRHRKFSYSEGRGSLGMYSDDDIPYHPHACA